MRILDDESDESASTYPLYFQDDDDEDSDDDEDEEDEENMENSNMISNKRHRASNNKDKVYKYCYYVLCYIYDLFQCYNIWSRFNMYSPTNTNTNNMYVCVCSS